MKTYRQSAILDLVEVGAITSQEQLREQLHRRGIEATQATLSRDIRDLGLIKRPADGAYRKPAPGELASPTRPAEELRVAVVDYLRHQETVEQLVVLKTDRGAAQPLAVAIDAVPVREIAGTIAGDDTILVICRSAADAAALARRLDEWRQG
jgi:transcriptional regulator of arginine metabolism